MDLALVIAIWERHAREGLGSNAHWAEGLLSSRYAEKGTWCPGVLSLSPHVGARSSEDKGLQPSPELREVLSSAVPWHFETGRRQTQEEPRRRKCPLPRRGLPESRTPNLKGKMGAPSPHLYDIMLGRSDHKALPSDLRAVVCGLSQFLVFFLR